MTWLAGALVLAWLGQALGGLWLVRLYQRLRDMARPPALAQPPVGVLVPVRGDPGGFLATLAAQDYPDWHVVFAVEDAADPAFPMLAAFCAEAPARRALVLAGPTTRRAQKLHNLLAALPLLRPEDAVLVTLDADTLPPPDTLRRLLRPVLAGRADLASGYRWLLPGPGLGGQLAALVDHAVATLPRLDRLSLVWGGAMAVKRAALARLDLPALWDQALSDDLTVSRAARAAGLVVHAPYDVRLPSPVDWPLTEGFTFARRQFRLVWLLARPFWWVALAGSLVPVAGCAAAVWLGWWPALALALLAQQARLHWRRGVAPMAEPRGAPGAGHWLGPWLAPWAMPFALLAVLAAPGRRLRWAGRSYALGPGGEVRAVRGSPKACSSTGSATSTASSV